MKNTTSNCQALDKENIRVVDITFYLMFCSPDTEILTGYRVGHAESMAYDWTSKVLFWTSSSYRVVVAFRVTDKSRRDIVTGLKSPRGLAVHPSAG